MGERKRDRVCSLASWWPRVCVKDAIAPLQVIPDIPLSVGVWVCACVYACAPCVCLVPPGLTFSLGYVLSSTALLLLFSEGQERRLHGVVNTIGSCDLSVGSALAIPGDRL